MAEQTNEITLEDVRNRFLEAETRLTDTVAAVAAIQEAAGNLGAARDGLGIAGQRLGGLAGSMTEVATGLAENAAHLREGVDAIRAGDPAEIRRQIEELDAAFTAMQSVVGERMSKLEEGQAALAVRVTEVLKALAAAQTAVVAQASRSRRDSLVGTVVVAALVIAAIAAGFVR